MKNFKYAINLVDSPSPILKEASSTDDVIVAFRKHNWDAQLSEMKRRFDNDEMYFLPQFSVSRGAAYIIVEPGYDGSSTVSAHKLNTTESWHYKDTNLHGYKFNESRTIEAITRFLNADDNWLWENLEN